MAGTFVKIVRLPWGLEDALGPRVRGEIGGEPGRGRGPAGLDIVLGRGEAGEAAMTAISWGAAVKKMTRRAPYSGTLFPTPASPIW